MSEVIIDIAMSLDGYIAGPNDTRENPFGENGAERILGWDHSDRLLMREIEDSKYGAMISGWRTYDLINGWNGTHPAGGGIPVFVVCEKEPDRESVPKGGTPFTFVTDGIESAVQQAKAAAGDKTVYVIGGANVIQQLLNKRLADEIRVHVVSVFVGDGVRLFKGLNPDIQLEQTDVSEGKGVVHLTYRPQHV